MLDLHSEWRSQHNRYIVQRATGLFVFHRIASGLLIPIMLDARDFSPQLVTSILSEADHWLDRDFGRVGGEAGAYSSGSGQKQLAEQIIDSIG